MAVSYHLEFAAPVTVERLAARFVALATRNGLLPAEASADDLTGDGVVLRAGMWCRAVEARPRTVPWPTPLEEDFGIVATCWTVFRVDSNRGPVPAQQDEMVWLCAGILAGIEGDAALQYQNEVAWLVRRDGRLVVSDDDEIWTAQRLGYLPQPFERERLVFRGMEGKA